MPAAIRWIAAALLTVVLITAHTALVKQSEWNGTINLEHILANPTRILPNTKIPINLPTTGVAAIDNYFAFMEAFFSTSLDPRNVRAHVAGNHLLGSLSSIWLLMLAEAHNSSSGFLFATYVIEFLGELLGVGILTPVWTIVHLFSTSPPSPKSRKPENSTRALGYAIVIGHAIPTFLMLRLQPDGEGFASQQFWTIARLFHPIFVFTLWTIFKTFFGSKTSSSQTAFFARRKFYVFSILASAFFHVTSLGWLLAEHMVSGWLKEDIAAALKFGTIVMPAPFWSADVVGKVAWEDGVAIFLQWDYLCSAAAIFIWAVVLFDETRMQGNECNGLKWVESFSQTILVSVLAGPTAGAAYLLWERDAILDTRASLSVKKTL